MSLLVALRATLNTDTLWLWGHSTVTAQKLSPQQANIPPVPEGHSLLGPSPQWALPLGQPLAGTLGDLSVLVGSFATQSGQARSKGSRGDRGTRGDPHTHG